MSEASGQTPNPQQQERAKVYFEKANDAAMKSNFDYAMDMYREALKLVPDNLLYRQSLRGVERRKFGNEPSRVSRLVGPRVQSIRLGAKTSKAKHKWLDVLETCEDAFKHDPWNVGVAEDMADAAEQLGWLPLAKWVLESVFTHAGDSASFLRHAAHVYELNENWEQASHCWERVRKVDPKDQDAVRKIKGLAAKATITRSGLEQAIHKAPEGVAGPERHQPDLDELKRTAMTPEDRLKKEIDDQPDHVGPYLNLAELYKSTNRLDEAERVLARGIKAVPGDQILITEHAEVQISRLKRAIQAYTKRVQDAPDDPEPKAKLDQTVLKFKEYELKEYTRRSGLHPDDMNLRFQLGLRLAALGKFDDAIAQFQQARNSTALKLQALYEAGRCFEEKRLAKLAERNYNEALKLTEANDEEMLKRLHYRLGRVAESQNDLKLAEEHYNEVAALDYTYEDIADRLRNLNPGG
jgi:tetratricopeptide (TPR) repeat protein